MATDAQINKLVAALEKLTSAMDPAERGQGGATTTTGRQRAKSAASIVDTAQMLDTSTEIKNAEQLLKILEEQVKAQEVKDARQGVINDRIREQNSVEQNILQRRLDVNNQDLQFQREILKTNIEALEERMKQGDLDEAALDKLGKRVAMLKLQSNEMVRQSELNSKMSGTLNEIDSKISSLTGLLMLPTDAYEKSIFGQIEKASGGDMKKMLGNTAQAIAQIGVSLARAVHPAGLFATAMQSLTNNTIDFVKTQNELLASFTKATGMTGKYRQMVVTTNVENKEFHLTLDDGSRAVTALLQNLRSFSNMTEDAQKPLRDFVARLESIGVSGVESTQTLNMATTALNMELEASQQLTADLSLASAELFGDQEKLGKEFRASLSTLAVYGKEAKKVFLGVAAAAKAAGMETSDLLGITEQFDTFQGAAEAVSGLNAILGGQYLNSLDLVGKSEDERIRTLIGTMEAANMSFDSLSKFEQKAIAAKLGITDMAKANQLFSMSAAEMDSQLAKVEGLKMTDEKLKSMREATADFNAIKTAAFERFVVMVEPLTKAVTGILQAFVSFVDFFDESPGTAFFIGLTAAIGSMLLFGKLTMMATGFLFGKATGLAANTVGTAALTRAMQEQTRQQLINNLMSQTGKNLSYEEAAARAAEMMATKSQTGAKVESTLAGVGETTQDVVADGVRKKSILTRISEKLSIFSGIGAKIASAAASVKERVAEAAGMVTRGFAIVQMGVATAAKYALATASGVLSTAFGVLGLASLSAGAKLAIIAGILLALAAVILVPMFSPPLYIGLGILAGAMVALAIASKFGTPGISAAATAMLALAKGTALAALATFKFSGALALAALALAGVAIAVAATAVSMGLLAITVGLVGLGAALGGPGLLAFSAGIIALEGALLVFAATSFITLPILAGIAAGMLGAGLGALMMAAAFSDQDAILGSLTSKLQTLDSVMANFSALNLVELSALTMMVDEIERLVDVVNKLDPFNMMTIGMTMQEIGSFTPDSAEVLSQVRGVIDATAASTPEQTTAVADMLQATARLAEQASAAETGIFEQIAGMITSAIGGEKPTPQRAPAAPKTTQVNLYMDRDGRKIFAKGIIDELGPEVERRLSISKGARIS